MTQICKQSCSVHMGKVAMFTHLGDEMAPAAACSSIRNLEHVGVLTN